MPQDYTEGLPLTKTPVQFLQHSGDREEINTIQLHLASLNFTYSEMHHPIYELSGGQQGKLYLLGSCWRKIVIISRVFPRTGNNTSLALW